MYVCISMSVHSCGLWVGIEKLAYLVNYSSVSSSFEKNVNITKAVENDNLILVFKFFSKHHYILLQKYIIVSCITVKEK